MTKGEESTAGQRGAWPLSKLPKWSENLKEAEGLSLFLSLSLVRPLSLSVSVSNCDQCEAAG